MTVLKVNGKWSRCYITGERGLKRFYLPVTYHKTVRGKVRQLTISEKLLTQVLRRVS